MRTNNQICLTIDLINALYHPYSTKELQSWESPECFYVKICHKFNSLSTPAKTRRLGSRIKPTIGNI